MFLIGFFAAFLLAVGKVFGLLWITDSAFFYLSLTMMILGTQFFLAGFLGDLISRTSNVRNDYQIEEKIG